MKKLLFVLAFSFIGQQALSQISMITIHAEYDLSGNGCPQLALKIYDPTGNQTTVCAFETSVGTLNQELNSIVSQGYELIEILYGGSGGFQAGFLDYEGKMNPGTTFILAIP